MTISGTAYNRNKNSFWFRCLLVLSLWRQGILLQGVTKDIVREVLSRQRGNIKGYIKPGIFCRQRMSSAGPWLRLPHHSYSPPSPYSVASTNSQCHMFARGMISRITIVSHPSLGLSLIAKWHKHDPFQDTASRKWINCAKELQLIAL